MSDARLVEPRTGWRVGAWGPAGLDSGGHPSALIHAAANGLVFLAIGTRNTGAKTTPEGLHDPGAEVPAFLPSVGTPQRHSSGGLSGASILQRAAPAREADTCQQTPLTLEDSGDACREGAIRRSLVPRQPQEL